MLNKNIKLNQWFWRWHLIAGLISIPFILMLAVTGAVYLFKTIYEENAYQSLTQLTEVSGQRQSIDEQWRVANQYARENGIEGVDSLILPKAADQSTQFFKGRFGPSESIFVNPYSLALVGVLVKDDTLMQKTKKLHSELWLGKYGTKIVELVASWLVVLILTGLYLWWPKDKLGWQALFRIRIKQGQKILLRDLHSVLGFWSSAVLFIILAGGLPWTDVFGKNFRTVQNITNTGYPATWFSSKALESTGQGTPMTLNEIVTFTKGLDLEGVVRIKLPKEANGVISIVNTAAHLSDQQSIHLDRYSGEILVAHTWSEVGALASGRQVVMRLHTGEFFGLFNWWVILLAAVSLSLMTISILVAYLKRRPVGRLGLPPVPEQLVVGKGLILFIIGLGVLFPLFGISVAAIVIVQLLNGKRRQFNAGIAQSRY